MARRSYGRSGRSRRRSNGNRWGLFLGAIVIGFIIYVVWPDGDTTLEGQESPTNPKTATDLPKSEPDVPNESDSVVSAAEFSPIVTNPTGSTSLPESKPTETVSKLAPPPVTTLSLLEVEQAVRDAMILWQQNSDRLVEVRTRLNHLLMQPLHDESCVLVKDALGKLSKQWLFSPRVFVGDDLCTEYNVQSGMRLATIGRHFQVPYQIIMMINGMTQATDLRADSKIKVVRGPFHAKVDLSSFSMDVYLQKTFVKSYKIGIGRHGHETPTGTWLVRPGDKHVRPQWTDPNGKVWYRDDPDYPLGDRWIGLLGMEENAVGRTGFAIHGTKDPQSIGKPSSEGCIRLYNGDVREVYNMLLDGKSKVTVSP